MERRSQGRKYQARVNDPVLTSIQMLLFQSLVSQDTGKG
jgi:hypothetical protein